MQFLVPLVIIIGSYTLISIQVIKSMKGKSDKNQSHKKSIYQDVSTTETASKLLTVENNHNNSDNKQEYSILEASESKNTLSVYLKPKKTSTGSVGTIIKSKDHDIKSNCGTTVRKTSFRQHCSKISQNQK